MSRIQVSKLKTLSGHKDCIYTLERGRSSNIFFSGAGDGIIAQWDLDDPEMGQQIARVKASVYAIFYEESRDQLVIGHNYSGIHIADVKKREETGSVELTDAAIFDIKVVDNRIFVGAGDGVITVVDYDTLNTVKHIKASENSVRNMAVNPYRNELAVGYSDNTFKIFDLTDYHLKKMVKAHDNSVFTVKYSPDYKHLLTGSRDAHLKIWDVENDYKPVNAIVAHMYTINHIDFSPDGNYFVTCSMDKSIKVWDAREYKLLKVIDKARHAGHGTSVNRLLWPDYTGPYPYPPVISASDDRTISIWNLNFSE